MKSIKKKALAVVLAFCCAMVGCVKLDLADLNAPTSSVGSIYGTVTDYASGDLLGNVNVCLEPDGESALTGSDGVFQFDNLSENYYQLIATKYGYQDYEAYNVYVEADKNVRWDIQLKKKHK